VEPYRQFSPRLFMALNQRESFAFTDSSASRSKTRSLFLTLKILLVVHKVKCRPVGELF